MIAYHLGSLFLSKTSSDGTYVLPMKLAGSRWKCLNFAINCIKSVLHSSSASQCSKATSTIAAVVCVPAIRPNVS